MSAASASSFSQAYRDIAQELRLPGFDDLKLDQTQLVVQWLKKEEIHWLMVLDNADDTDLFFPTIGFDNTISMNEILAKPLVEYLPLSLNVQKALLVTTRNRILGTDLAHGESSIEVRPFSFQEGVNLLQKKVDFDLLPSDDDSCRKLLEVLGCIPLAITQAAAFMKRNRMTLSEYHAALDKDESSLIEHLSQELQDPQRPRGTPNSVFRTWKISFDYLSVHEPQAARMLSLTAILDHQSIPEIIMRQLVDTDVELSMATGTLDGFSLITKEPGRKAFTLHPLIHTSLQHWLQEKGERAFFGSLGLQILADVFSSYNYEHRQNYQALMPHFHALLRFQCILDEDLKRRANILRYLSWWQMADGKHASAHSCASKAYELARQTYGEASVLALEAIGLQVRALDGLGKYRAAEDAARRALEGYEKYRDQNMMIL